jgi:4-hydroxy-4-methyl-2-oxoglutarate aldolase
MTDLRKREDDTMLTPEQIQALRQVDTPTICNAIETFNIRGRVEGFMGMAIRCLLPELGTMAGYAVTLTVDSTTPAVAQDPQVWLEWMTAMANSSRPVVLVMQDVGPTLEKSAHLGEVMGTLAKRLGVVGIVTDGGLRDILEVKALGLQCFAAGLTPAHGNPRLLKVNVPVVIDGVPVHPGDLLHGDINGITTIPLEIADRVMQAVEKIRRDEARTMAYIKSSDFTIEGLYKRRFTH